MPSTSKKQARFMAAAAHDPKFAKKVHMSQKVAKDFNKADVKTGILKDSKLHNFIIAYEYHQNIHYYKASASSAAEAKENFLQHISQHDKSKVKVLSAQLTESTLDNHSRWVLDGGMNGVQEDGPSFMGKPRTGAPALGPKSVALVDKAILYISQFDKAEDRQEALENFASAHKASYQDLYDLITQETGGDYFTKDSVPESAFTKFSKKVL